MIYRECVRGGKESSEASFYISSLPPKVKRIAATSAATGRIAVGPW
jgi:hypothetical protein